MNTSLPRPGLRQRIEETLNNYPVVLLLGPRQCGKTTLARQIAQAHGATYFDLEDPDTALKPETASITLRGREGLIVIDEFQRMPKLFELLRVLADRRPLPARFLILGSASPAIVKGVSESMAGRVAYIPMGGFDLEEAGEENWRRLWNRGRFPDSFLATNDAASFDWRLNFIQSFIERDLPQLGVYVPTTRFRRYWIMLAHLHGQTWNASAIARNFETKQTVVSQYLDVLSGAFMIRQLPPWFENVGKRLVKSPKIYFRDTGVLHALLVLRDAEEVLSHPRFGFSWEGFAMEEIITRLQAEREAFFYKTHSGAELDLFISRGNKRYGFEFKYQTAPSITKSMRSVIEDLRLDKLYVIYPGLHRYPLSEQVDAVALTLIDDLREECA